jgi:hypothetical protein
MTYPPYPSHLGRARRRRLHALLAMNDAIRFFSVYIPGGVFTTIALVRLSADEKIRQVAVLWNALPRKEHKTVNLDQLCLNVGLTPACVLGSIVETAYDLGMDVAQMVSALLALPGAIQWEMTRARKKGSWCERERFLSMVGFMSKQFAPRHPVDPTSDLAPVEKETMEFTRSLKPRLRREQRPDGRS